MSDYRFEILNFQRSYQIRHFSVKLCTRISIYSRIGVLYFWSNVTLSMCNLMRSDCRYSYFVYHMVHSSDGTADNLTLQIHTLTFEPEQSRTERLRCAGIWRLY